MNGITASPEGFHEVFKDLRQPTQKNGRTGIFFLK
jgi:hypothetical protein